MMGYIIVCSRIHPKHKSEKIYIFDYLIDTIFQTRDSANEKIRELIDEDKKENRGGAYSYDAAFFQTGDK